MSADGDIVRGAGLTKDELAALARLEAAEERSRLDANELLADCEKAEAQRDALAEALRWYADGDEKGGAIARRALAEAGLE